MLIVGVDLQVVLNQATLMYMYFYVTTQCHNLPIRAASSLDLLAFLVELVVDSGPLSFN